MLYTFGEFTLDTRRCELRRDGEAQHLEPQVYAVLCYLVENRERLVTRHELLDHVWGHRFVTPATLSSRIKALRKALGDDGGAQRVIRTVRGLGFRFLLPVEVHAEEGGPRRRLAAILHADVVGYSRLSSEDEDGTHRRLTECRARTEAAIERHGGRVVQWSGDAVLADFPTASEALAAAVAIQSDPAPLRLRIGVNLGEVIVEAGDVFGEGVNVAARLQGLAEPGGICVSESLRAAVGSRLRLTYEFLGERALKNIPEPVRVYRVRLDAGAAPEREPASSARTPHIAVLPFENVSGDPPRDVGAPAAPAEALLEQEIRFCHAHDGVRIAFATSGRGPPLVKTANWLTHLEFDWDSPVWRHWMAELSRDHTLVRYDERGCGLSDREVEDVSFEAWLGDLERVVDERGLDRFPLLGVSQGCAVAVAYAARHPERVSRLVLYGGFALGRFRRARDRQEAELAEMLIRVMPQGWGSDNPAFRYFFATLFLPEGTPEQMGWFCELQRVTTSPENGVRLRTTSANIDVREEARAVRAPTLVLHGTRDAAVPFEQGRLLAALIPGARFVPLDSRNHILFESEPAWRRFVGEFRAFLTPADAAALARTE